jgi:hypothetical protein
MLLIKISANSNMKDKSTEMIAKSDPILDQIECSFGKEYAPVNRIVSCSLVSHLINNKLKHTSHSSSSSDGKWFFRVGEIFACNSIVTSLPLTLI